MRCVRADGLRTPLSFDHGDTLDIDVAFKASASMDDSSSSIDTVTMADNDDSVSTKESSRK